MGARQKLNSVTITGGLALASVLGCLTNSWIVFIIAALIKRQWMDPAGHRDGFSHVLSYMYAYSGYLFFDFAGYSAFAIGASYLFGIHTPENFNRPFLASNIRDFWNRWHISLSTWFKDYLYFPLGGSRGGTFRTYRNMFITMVVSGIWHGAAWTFVIWGVLHAIGRTGTRELEAKPWYRDRIPRFVKQVFVFAFVCLAWIFFRAPTVTDARIVLTRIFTTGWGDPQFPVVMGALIVAVWIYEELFANGAKTRSFLELNPVRVAMAVVMVLWLAVVAQPSTQSFIYFQF
jgi:D-alanyl-lipoteichoic acid acyltransferase DltB (MBOAT superfamily)